MATFAEVHSMAIHLGFVPENVDEEGQLFTITDLDRGINRLIVDCEHPILILEQMIMPMPGSLYAKLVCLELLAANRELVHGAYAYNKSQNVVTWRDTLELSHLDLNELEASINALSLGLSEHAGIFLRFALFAAMD